MLDIAIFKAEADIEGLAEKVRANRSISYVSLLQPAKSTRREAILSNAVKTNAALAAIQDLYPTESILASTVYNLNDDMFPKWDTFQARSTPINKPDNIEHDEEQIVGHMVSSWLIDAEGGKIDETSIAKVEDLPDLFHVCNASVIYTHWSKAEWQDKVAILIEEIEAGKKYVSMECLFPAFDYAMIDTDNNLEIVNRNASTAFLTKHLRAYGGSGVYNDKRVYRVLRNFVFSGKGYVDAPANPDSIIFSKGMVQVVDFSTATYKNSLNDSAGVYLNNEQLVAANDEKFHIMETKNMSSELELLQSQLSEAKDALKGLTEANKTLEEKITKAGIAQYESKIEKLEASVTEATEAATKANDETKGLTTKVADLEAKIKELTEANATLTQEAAVAEEAKVRASRVSTLVDGGVDKTAAETKVDLFSNLNEEQFSVVATEIIAAVSQSSENPEGSAANDDSSDEDDSTVDVNDANASQADLDDVEADDDDIAGAAAAENEATALAETRQALATYVSQRLGKTVSSDDEADE